jgi:hypothetical protein
MSQYLNMATQIVSGEHLVKALKDVGFNEVEVYKKAQPLRGWMGDLRANTAEIIIRKKYVGSASNDIGFKLGSDGRFTAFISDFDKNRFNTVWLNHLTQRYAYHVARDKLQEKGFDLVEESVQEDQTIHLTLRKMATLRNYGG